jgi:cysteine desulfurase
MKKVYLDNAATTITAPEVVEAMMPYFDVNYGNASSLHEMGVEAKRALERSRESVAKRIGASPDEIIFTSGGTESNNLALKGTAFFRRGEKNHIITSRVEHECVLNSCKWLRKQGFEVTYLDVDGYGFVDTDQLEKSITGKTAMVSIIHGNNEIGTVNDIEEIAKICHEKGTIFHTDACQSFTKTELDVKKQDLDLVTINSHKIHGPKGVGALYIRNKLGIEPWQHGGGHERNLRSGTENIPGIVGFATAAEIAGPEHVEYMTRLRGKLIKGLLDANPDAWLNGHPVKRLCNNANIGFKHIEGEGILLYLSQKGIMVSTGSACSSHSLEPDHVLTAIGLRPEDSHGVIRMSLSRYTTEEEIDYAIQGINEVAGRLREMSPYT